MRRSALLGAALATSLMLTTPVLGGSADAAAGHGVAKQAAHSAAKTADRTADRKKGKHLKVKRSKKGVQPGITGEKITALPGKKAKGKVKFILKGTGIKEARKVKVKKGKAVYKVPPLGTGKYKVKVSYKNLKGKTKFEVYDSAVTLSRTTLTVSQSDDYIYTNGGVTGSVKYKGKVASGGYFDVYKDGNVKGGEDSADFLGFTTLEDNGTFDYGAFGENVSDRYGVGTYNFVGYYTPTASFADYVSSNVIVVTVVP